MADSTDRKTNLAALRERIVPVAKSDDLLGIAHELDAIGQELAREEKPEGQASRPVIWPRDMNVGSERTAPEWGHDPAAQDAHG